MRPRGTVGSLLPIPAEPNPMRVWHGAGPDGAKCKTCVHLSAHSYARTYYKCAYRGTSGNPRTDHRVGWRACGLYQEAK